MLGYIISCIILGLILLGYIPAMIAAGKNHPFLRWYIFGVIIFPVALIYSLCLKKPVRVINVLSSKASGGRKKKSYKQVSVKKETKFSVGYVLTVLLTKAIFGAFLGLAAFALIRTFTPDTTKLRTVCVIFSAVHTILTAVTEIFGFSRFPLMADEITKRAIQIFVISIVSSVPMFLLSYLITTNILFHTQFVRFLFTFLSFCLFLTLLFKLQGRYYGRFSRFFDYCILSVFSYIVFSATTLVWISLTRFRETVYALSMQMQLFNFTYFSGVEYIDDMSYIYLGALTHLIVVSLLILSGLRCMAYKKKELAFKIEYRTKAFRISHKPALYRHIPKAGIKIKTSLK